VLRDIVSDVIDLVVNNSPEDTIEYEGTIRTISRKRFTSHKQQVETENRNKQLEYNNNKSCSEETAKYIGGHIIKQVGKS
jgi:hypothetical protein